MSRIRSVKPEWLEDERLALASSDARVLSIALILIADDYGNGRAHPRLLAGRVFPGLGADVAERALQELVDLRFAELYDESRQTYFHIRNWSKHQRIDNAGAPRVPREPSPEGEPADAARGGSRNFAAARGGSRLDQDQDQDQDPDHDLLTRGRASSGTRREVDPLPEPPEDPALNPPAVEPAPPDWARAIRAFEAAHRKVYGSELGVQGGHLHRTGEGLAAWGRATAGADWLKCIEGTAQRCLRELKARADLDAHERPVRSRLGYFARSPGQWVSPSKLRALADSAAQSPASGDDRRPDKRSPQRGEETPQRGSQRQQSVIES